MKIQTRLSGSGGQGLILGGILLAEAAILDGKKALQSQSYGPESRGGSSRSDVIISDKPIYFPRATELDNLLCLTQESADKFLEFLKPDGVFFYDSSQIKINPIDAKSIGIPFTEKAIEKFKTPLVANIVALSFIGKITNIVSLISFKKALKMRIKPKYLEMNLNAVKFGIQLAEKFLKSNE